MINVKCFPSGPLLTNTYIAYDENGNAFVVDPGGYGRQLSHFVKENNLKVDYIILTHGHSDHIGGVNEHKEEWQFKVVAPAAEKDMLRDPMLNFSHMTHGYGISVEADVWVSEGEILKIGSMELKFIMTPGHTPGGMCVLVEDRLFSGDTIFRASIGRTDFPGGSFSKLVESIRNKLFVLDDNIKVYPGHMGETLIGYEKENNPFV